MRCLHPSYLSLPLGTEISEPHGSLTNCLKCSPMESDFSPIKVVYFYVDITVEERLVHSKPTCGTCCISTGDTPPWLGDGEGADQ